MTRYQELQAEVAAKVAELNAKKTELFAELKDSVGDLFKTWFEANPEFDSVGWRNYAVYFNDGDECRFRVRNDTYELIVNGEDYWLDNLEDPAYGTEEYKAIDQALQAFSDIVDMLGEDFCYQVYGNNSEVTAYRDGRLTVESYTDHD